MTIVYLVTQLRGLRLFDWTKILRGVILFAKA